MLGAGDIGMCGRPEVAQTARLVAGLEGDVLLAGDIAYPQGTAANFRDCFNPFWGQFRSRWHPVPGNHEYESAGAAPYFAYFGDAAGPAGLGYYSFTAGDWLILMLNSNIAATRGSPQWEFVRAELEGQRTPCTMAVWHHPLFTSGPNGNNAFMRDMWALLEASRVEVSLQRPRSPVRALRAADFRRHCPIRSTASGSSPRAPAARISTASCAPRQNSEERIMKFGVVRFTLRPAQVDWEFLGIDGSVSRSRPRYLPLAWSAASASGARRGIIAG